MRPVMAVPGIVRIGDIIRGVVRVTSVDTDHAWAPIRHGARIWGVTDDGTVVQLRWDGDQWGQV